MKTKTNKKAKAFTVKGAAVLIIAAVLATALLFTACPNNAVGNGGGNSGSSGSSSGDTPAPTEYTTLSYGTDGTAITNWLRDHALPEPEVNYIEVTGITDGNLIGEDLEGTLIGACPLGKIIKNSGKKVALKLPANITEIGKGGFFECENLVGIDLSACTGLTKIDEKGFYKTGLTELDLPASLNSIGERAFADCKDLKSLRVDTANQTYKSEGNIVYTKNGSTLVAAARGLTNVTILNDVTEILPYAFSGCSTLTAVNFPASLRKIGYEAFSGCIGIKTINLKDNTNLTEIADSAFYGCKGLISADLRGCRNLTRIGASAFYNCEALTRIELNGCTGLTTIDGSAFYNCKVLDSVDLSGCTHLTAIYGGVFSGCTGLTFVNMHGCIGLTKIEGGTFLNCTALGSVNLTDCTSLEEIGGGAFENTALTAITLPAVNLNLIGGGAFNKCSKLKTVDLSQYRSIDKIGADAFSDCKEAEVKLPASVTTIEEYAFGMSATDWSVWCKKVLIKSGATHAAIKQKVIDSGYPEARIGSY